MRRIVGRTATIAIGACLTVAAVAAQAASPPVATAEPDDPPAWGKVWHPAFTPRMGASSGRQHVQRVGDRYAVAGGDDRGAVVWWSDDGIEWQRTKRSVATDHGQGVSITGGPDGYVLVGHQWTPTPRGRIWHSTDGLHWMPTASKLPPDSNVWSVAVLDDGTFVAYGAGGRRGDCWMGSSADGGETWEFRWEGDWDPGQPGGCATSVVHDEDGLLGRVNLGGISESGDGVTWRELVSAQAIRDARPKGEKHYNDLGLVPFGDGRFLLGVRGKRALIWSRADGLERIDSPVDLTGRRGLSVALAPESAVAVRAYMPAPLRSPPADVYTERWERREPVCRPGDPRIGQIAAMTPSARLECYRGRELTFEAWIPFAEFGGTCPFGDPYTWIICEDYPLTSGPGPSPANLGYGLAPTARFDKGLGVGSRGQHVRVTGHFDDPAAALCPEPGWNGKVPQGWQRMTRTDFVDECREQFIVTEMRRVKD